MYDLNLLNSFIVLAEELHFGRAATRLNMSQSPLTRQIQKLEHVMGVALFLRTSRTVALTQAGRFLYPEAKRIIRMSEAATTLARRVAEGLQGSLSVGFTPTSAFSLMPHLARACLEELPSIHVQFKEADTREQLDGLASGEIDIGIIRPLLDRPGVKTVPVLQEPLVAALPADHSFAARERLDITDFSEQPFVGYSYESRYFSALINAHFMEADVQPVIMQEIGNIHAILPLVSRGVGLALVPASVASFFSRGIVYRPLRSPLGWPVELHLAIRTEAQNPLRDRVMDIATNLRAATVQGIDPELLAEQT